MKEKLYKKIYNDKGEECGYEQVNDPYALDGLSKGCWLVKVEPGSTSIRTCVEPSNASVDFAFWMMSDKLASIISDASEARAKSKGLTAREQKALKAFYKVMGEEKILYFEYPAIQDIADKIIQKVREGRRE